MSYVVCTKCNTIDHKDFCSIEKSRVLCSMCKPGSNGQWHNRFSKEQYDPLVHRVLNKPNGIGLG